MRYSKLLLLFILSLITAALLAPLQAQDATPAPITCGAVLDSLWANASNACINQPGGYVCNGGAAPAAVADIAARLIDAGIAGVRPQRIEHRAAGYRRGRRVLRLERREQGSSDQRKDEKQQQF